MEIKRRFFQPSETSFFLFGPRGTGKSTWLHAHLQDALLVDLLAPETYRLYAARPERLRELIAGNPAKDTVIIDEVQKLPELLDVVHQLIEQHRSLRFVLTGSSARKLKRTGIDLLAGRAVLKTMHPFMAAELGGLLTWTAPCALVLCPWSWTQHLLQRRSARMLLFTCEKKSRWRAWSAMSATSRAF